MFSNFLYTIIILNLNILSIFVCTWLSGFYYTVCFVYLTYLIVLYNVDVSIKHTQYTVYFILLKPLFTVVLMHKSCKPYIYSYVNCVQNLRMVGPFAFQNLKKLRSGRRLTYSRRSRALRVQCNIEEVKVFESLRDMRVDPDLDAPAPPPPSSSRRSNQSEVALRAPLTLYINHNKGQFYQFITLRFSFIILSKITIQDISVT